MSNRSPDGPSLYRVMGMTIASSYGQVAFAFATGIVLARALEPSGRGYYAVVVSSLSILLVFGELGQSSAVTYQSAKFPARIPEVLRGSQRVMLQAGCVALAVWGSVLIFVAEAPGDALTICALGFVALGANSLLGPFQYVLQARSLRGWNLSRLGQAGFLTLGSLTLFSVGALTVTTALACFLASTVAGLGISYFQCRRLGLRRGSYLPITYLNLVRYGARDAAAGAPYVASQHLDKPVLATLIATEQIGQYAVALSVMALGPPLAAAAGAVLMPAHAGRGPQKSLYRATNRIIAVHAILAIAVGLAGYAAIPVLYGTAFGAARELALLLVPASIGRGISMLLTSELRGLGRPASVALGYWTSLAVSVGMMVLLVPTFGIAGACLALSFAECICATLLWRSVTRLRAALPSPHADPPSIG